MSKFDRRSFLIHAGAATGGAVLLHLSSRQTEAHALNHSLNRFFPPSMAALGTQKDWRYCTKCHTIFFDGYADKGRCAAGAGHVAAGYNFVLPHDVAETPTAQKDWRFCNKCHEMFFDGYADKGHCAAGGGHVAAGYVFVLPHDVAETPTAQRNWRFCAKCHAMFFDGYADKGRCPADAIYQDSIRNTNDNRWATEKAIDLNPLAVQGQRLANADPLAADLRNRQPAGPGRRGFDVGMAAAEGQTLPGPGKQRIHDSLSPAEQRGFDAAVSFSLERNRNADLAARGAAIARADPIVAEARAVDTDESYLQGFDIATAIFGDPALGAQGNTATGPGSLRIRDSLSAAGQRGFNDSVKLHLGRKYKRPSAEVKNGGTEGGGHVAAGFNFVLPHDVPDTPPVPDNIHLRADITTPDWAPIGGWVDIRVNDQGHFTVSGHMHNSGALNIQYSLAAVLMTPSGAGYGFAREHQIDGSSTLFDRNRDDDWNKDETQPEAAANWSQVSQSRLYCRLVASDTLSKGLQGLVEDIIKEIAKEYGKKAVIALIEVI
jgi:hypothetical protein